jgi:hypothetical protein
MKKIILVIVLLSFFVLQHICLATAECIETVSLIECTASLTNVLIHTDKNILIHDAVITGSSFSLSTSASVSVENSQFLILGLDGADGIDKDYSYPNLKCDTIKSGSGKHGQNSSILVQAKSIELRNSAIVSRAGNGGEGGLCFCECRSDYYECHCTAGDGGQGGASFFNLTADEISIYNSSIESTAGNGAKGGNAGNSCRRAGQTCTAFAGNGGSAGSSSFDIDSESSYDIFDTSAKTFGGLKGKRGTADWDYQGSHGLEGSIGNSAVSIKAEKIRYYETTINREHVYGSENTNNEVYFEAHELSFWPFYTIIGENIVFNLTGTENRFAVFDANISPYNLSHSGELVYSGNLSIANATYVNEHDFVLRFNSWNQSAVYAQDYTTLEINATDLEDDLISGCVFSFNSETRNGTENNRVWQAEFFINETGIQNVTCVCQNSKHHNNSIEWNFTAIQKPVETPVEEPVVIPEPEPVPIKKKSSGGGGGSSPAQPKQETKVCISDWKCTEWSNCTNSTKTRTCSDINRCGSMAEMPNTKEKCETELVIAELVAEPVIEQAVIPEPAKEPELNMFWLILPTSIASTGAVSFAFRKKLVLLKKILDKKLKERAQEKKFKLKLRREMMLEEETGGN